jgi:hypothetical protein
VDAVTAIPTVVTNQIVALATLVGSAQLCTTTVIACGLLITLGAVYTPSEIVPTCGTNDQLTLVSGVPLN